MRGSDHENRRSSRWGAQIMKTRKAVGEGFRSWKPENLEINTRRIHPRLEAVCSTFFYETPNKMLKASWRWVGKDSTQYCDIHRHRRKPSTSQDAGSSDWDMNSVPPGYEGRTEVARQQRSPRPSPRAPKLVAGRYTRGKGKAVPLQAWTGS